MPFIVGHKKEEKILELLKIKLSELNINYLLFLTNMETINWKTPLCNGVYKKIYNSKDKRFISLASHDTKINYFLTEKNIQIDNKNLTIKLAFQIKEDSAIKIIPVDASPLYVFFPTKIETNLKFLVHAPFYTTPARENIQEGDNLINIKNDHRNEELKSQLGKLLSESLSIFKGLNLLDVDFLTILPIDHTLCDRSEIYKELYRAVKTELCSKKKLLPNSNGGFSSLDKLMLLGSSDLADLLIHKQAKKLFGRPSWIDKKVTNDRTKLLRDYQKL